MSTRKPCPREVKGQICGRPKMPGKQRCLWHWLLAQSSDVQANYARRRLDQATSPYVARVTAADCPEGERWCAGCQSFVPLFYVTGSRCKACSSMAAHERRLAKVYGIDAAEYERIFALQGFRCGICGNKPASIRFAVDHDHKTGAVRGILCKRCNHDLLGGGHDSVELLWRAIQYLLYPPAERDVRPSREKAVAALVEHLEWLDRLRAPAPAPEATLPPF